MSVLSRFLVYTRRRPVVRGMLSYAAIWPTSCIIQQTIAGKTWENYDWKQALRFCLYGSIFTAPTLYAWVRISTHIWPQTTLKTALIKACVEQVTYGPFAMGSFFFIMNYVKTYSIDEAKEEVKHKFWPTYKVAVCVWPILQTVNFLYIKERNRVPYVSVCSMIWCCFLAYMHELQAKQAATSIMDVDIRKKSIC